MRNRLSLFSVFDYTIFINYTTTLFLLIKLYNMKYTLADTGSVKVFIFNCLQFHFFI